MNPAGVALVVLGMLLSTASAHIDETITIGSDGELRGLPPEYSPAKLSVTFSDFQGFSLISGIELKVGSSEVVLPPCIYGLLGSSDMTQITASASWYHDERNLPHYLALTFYEPEFDPSRMGNNGLDLLFNLRTARLIEAIALLSRDGGSRYHRVTIDLVQQCGIRRLRGVVP